MKRNRALVTTVVITCLGGCGGPERGGSPEARLAAWNLAQAPWCPSGFLYDSSYRMCVNRVDALGPFSDTMIAKCKEYGGGPACHGEKWAVSFARKIRGTRECLPGTNRDPLRQACVKGEWFYGPFPSEAVQKCHELGGGAVCDTMRWPKRLWPIEGNPASEFRLPPPAEGDTTRLSYLWATYYYLPQVDNVNEGFALRGMDGNSLGPVLSRKDWCNAAMEGSVYIRSGSGAGTTYNYAGTSDAATVDCSMYFPRINVSRTKFRKAVGAFGDGVRDYVLVPYRTVAVDPTVIPYGTVIYIPAARGQTITRPDGTSFIHDGYFFAGDTGGAIKKNHIDVFVGLSETTPFPWVKSVATGTFKAQILGNDTLDELLSALHAPPPSPEPTPTPEPEPTAAPEPTAIPEPTAAPEAPTPAETPAGPAEEIPVEPQPGT